ncbi:MAG: hypothetical protein RLZZ416_351 [Candidatus Parcubacteria bacterium]|jgi:uncharacterized protein (DUF983 family)
MSEQQMGDVVTVRGEFRDLKNRCGSCGEGELRRKDETHFKCDKCGAEYGIPREF